MGWPDWRLLVYSPFRTGDSTVDRNLDSIKAELDKTVAVPAITAWKAYTPVTQGMGTLTAAYFFYRRVGEDLQLRAAFTVGTVTAAEVRIGLPTSPQALMAANNPLIPTAMLAGYSTYGQATGSTFAPTIIIQPGKTYFNVGAQNIGNPGITPLAGNAIFGNNFSYYIFASCPISGWTVNE